MMTKTLNRFLAAALTLAALVWGGQAILAQATITATTLSAAVAQGDQSVTVASATGFAANNLLVVDGEAMSVRSVSGTTINVSRGVQGTAAGPHGSGGIVLTGTPAQFSTADPVGPCTATSEVALPRVVIGAEGSRPRAVSVYQCTGATATTQRWQLFTKNGYPSFSIGSGGTNTATAVTYTATGAINPQPGVIFLNAGSALAMTLRNPTLAENGMVMVLKSQTAQLHTVTYTAGFDGGTTARDVASYTATIGDDLVVVANNLVWWVISTRGVTLA